MIRETLADRLSLTTRFIGAILVAVGVGMSYLGVYEPYVHIVTGAKPVTIDFRSVMLAALGIGYGVAIVVLGDRSFEVFNSGKSTKAASAIGAICVLAGIAAYFWLTMQLKSHGQ